jgi:cytochrome c5
MKRGAAWLLAAALLAGDLAVAGIAAAGDDDTNLARRGRGRGSDDVYEYRESVPRGAPAGTDADAAASPEDADAKALFEAKCSICHELSRPLSRNRERKWWVETVTRMQKVNGCPVTDEEAGIIIDYLARIRGPAGR